ncbi:hypothetical protein CR513_34752, partial [Mucuna pruriens]
MHVGTLSMAFGDNLVQLNIFEAMRHLTEDHSLFRIDLIDKLVKEHLQLDTSSDEFSNFAGDNDVFDCLGSITYDIDYDKLWKVLNLFDSEDDIADLANLVPPGFDFNVKRKVESNSNNQSGAESNLANLSRKQSKVEIMSTHLVSNLNQVDQSDPKPTDNTFSSPSPPIELKLLPGHLKYAYLGNDQVEIISICMHRILMEEEAHPIRQQQQRLNPTILDMVKKEVTKLLVAEIMYPISDS